LAQFQYAATILAIHADLRPVEALGMTGPSAEEKKREG